MKKQFKLVSLLLSIFLCCTAMAFAQERFGSIEGTIKDTNGAVIPNATVVVTGNAFERTVTTNEDGYFRLASVPPGSYTAQISGVNSTTGVALVEVYDVP